MQGSSAEVSSAWLQCHVDSGISLSLSLSVSLLCCLDTEATCVDGEFTDTHETDTDCGGPYCPPCPHGKVCPYTIPTLEQN